MSRVPWPAPPDWIPGWCASGCSGSSIIRRISPARSSCRPSTSPRCARSTASVTSSARRGLWAGGGPVMGRASRRKREGVLGPAGGAEEPLTARHEAIAASLQAVFEETALHVLNGLHQRTRFPRLCLAGGCAMNSVLNGKIRQRTPFREVYVQPASADNGTALGAALYAWHHTLGQPRSFVMDHGYWGPEFDDTEVERVLSAQRRRLADERCVVQQHLDEDALCRWTADRIAGGRIVGWFQGRMEWGPRGVGNTKILA